ncbi:MAG: DUF3108 domain-containing protein [Pseudomonadota bacterium]
MPGSLRNAPPASRRRAMQALTLLSLVIAAMAFPNIGRTEAQPAFTPGERLVYRLRWTIVDAGEAELNVRPMTTIDGQTAWHFTLSVRSNAFIDAFYKVRDVVDAYADTGMTRSVYYKKEQHEGRTERDVTVAFDWKTNTARYTKVEKEGIEAKTSPLMAGSFDPLSALFFVRSVPITGTGMIIERPITDGNKNVVGQVRVVKREKITVRGKSYDTFLIEPDLKHVGGVFEKSPGAKIQIWVTADHRHIPILLKSEVIVGSFVGELMEASGI